MQPAYRRRRWQIAARAHNDIIPVLNKIDMPHARIEETKQELRLLGFHDEEMMEISAKTGQNVNLVLSAILARIPRRRGNRKPRFGPDLSSHYDTPGW